MPESSARGRGFGRSLSAGLLLCAACGPPKASQFVGQDGSRDWWRVDCRGDEAACIQQASDACGASFDVRELRTDETTTQPLTISVNPGASAAFPAGMVLAHKTLVITCHAPTVAPAAVAGPECDTSPPRENHCDVADGLTFRTGRTYLPPGTGPAPTPLVDGLSPDAALAELRTIADGLDAEVAAIAAPINDIDGIVKDLHDFPRTYRAKPAQVKALAKATLGGKPVTLPSDMRSEVAEEMNTLLAKVKAEQAALNATPDKAAALLEKIATRHARVKVLAKAASAPWDAKLRVAGVPDAERAKADASLADIQQLQVDAREKLDGVRTHVTELSSLVMQALGKLGDAT